MTRDGLDFIIGMEDEPPTTHDERMREATAGERATIARLRLAGWHVTGFGQAMLEPAFRKVLRRTESDVRWFPDIAAVRNGRACFADAKTSMPGRETLNWSIEIRSYQTELRFMALYGDPLFYVFPDGGTTIAPDLAIETLMPGSSRGSGTPFLLTRRSAQGSFDELLGADCATDWGRNWRLEATNALFRLEGLIEIEWGPSTDIPPEFWREK